MADVQRDRRDRRDRQDRRQADRSPARLTVVHGGAPAGPRARVEPAALAPDGRRQATRVLPLRPMPVRTIAAPDSFYTGVVKPAFDRTAAGAALAVLAVPMAIVALVVLVAIGRPVLFRQTRVGKDGESFEVLKFRTMRADRRSQSLTVLADRRETHKSERDPRHTRVGRFLRRYSLDELPQLINVLRGEMSIVGPRPELASVVAGYRPGLEQRHLVKPGLTGLWQVSARGAGPMHENPEWDLAYVEQVSMRCDLSILARTPRAMLGRNAGA